MWPGDTRFLEYLPVLLYFLRLGSRGLSGTTGGWTMGGRGTKAGLLGCMPAALLRCAMSVAEPLLGTT